MEIGAGRMDVLIIQILAVEHPVEARAEGE
jgi:hypothetical protein